MSPFARAEVEAIAHRFAAANARAEEERNWAPLADFYTDDAVYTYVGLTSGGAVEARGKEEIRKIVMGRDMEDYAGWTFPFAWIAIDGNRIITRWSNRAPERRADGTPIECPGMSVLEYAGEGRFSSQFDLYDRLSVQAVIEEARAARGDAPGAKAKSRKKGGKKKSAARSRKKSQAKKNEKAKGKSGKKAKAKKKGGKGKKK